MNTQVERMLPLYEAKMLDSFDHRDADIVKSPTAEKRQNQPRYLSDQEKCVVGREPLPLSWIREELLPNGLPDWLTGFSDVTSATNERTVLAAALPRAGVGHTYPLWFSEKRAILLALFNSFMFDYLARQKVAGLHLTYTYVKQLPAPYPELFEQWCPWDPSCLVEEWINQRVIRLSYTSWSLRPMSTELGGPEAPEPWHPESRELLRAELDAAIFHLYDVRRPDVEHILSTFSSLERSQVASHGEYRTKRLILEAYDRLTPAAGTVSGH